MANARQQLHQVPVTEAGLGGVSQDGGVQTRTDQLIVPQEDAQVRHKMIIIMMIVIRSTLFFMV
jgi:hypothetical protein